VHGVDVHQRAILALVQPALSCSEASASEASSGFGAELGWNTLWHAPRVRAMQATEANFKSDMVVLHQQKKSENYGGSTACEGSPFATKLKGAIRVEFDR
jgi:hypothetical protein